MRLNDPLANKIELAGNEYDLNLSFNNVLDVLDVLNEKNLLKETKLKIMAEMLIGENNLTFSDHLFLWQEVLENYINKPSQEAVQYDVMGNPMPVASSEGEDSDVRLIDFELDANYIYASFRQIGINLFDEQEKMHWEEFQAILEALPDDTILKKIIRIRTYKPRKGESAKEKARMLELQKKYQLPNGKEE